MSETNRRIVLAERPRYNVPTANCFRLEVAPLPALDNHQLRVRTLYLSLDPYLHGRLKRTTTQAEPVKVGDVMVGATVGRVQESRHPDYAHGDLVYGFWGWQDYAVTDPRTGHLRKLPADLTEPSWALGALGLPGFGAWLALNDLAPAQPGETVLTGTAIGALGQIAGQIAKLKGCRAVGIAGGAEKCRIAVQTLGFDACIDHTAKDFPAQLRAACPQGVDVYVETVGGKVLDATLPLLNLNARIAVCGLMSLIGEIGTPRDSLRAATLLNETINRRLSIRGLVTFDHLNARWATFEREMLGWLNNGKIKPLEDRIEGLEKAPQAIQGLFEGRNRGKLIVRVGAA